MTGTLYICATPIGHLGDITLRCLETLKSVDLILAEDTRVTRKLLSHYTISTPLKPYHAYNEVTQTPFILDQLKAGHSLALVSDAGLPGIADPAYHLVQAVYQAELNVTVIPGASAPLMALVLSGLPNHPFVFLGFLPRKTSHRQQLFAKYKSYSETLVCFEAPHRLLKTLNDLFVILGERQIAICRELTKRFEEIHRGNVSKLIQEFEVRPPKGEITLVIEGITQTESQIGEPSELADLYEQFLQQGFSPKEAIKEISKQSDLSKNQLYQLLATKKE